MKNYQPGEPAVYIGGGKYHETVVTIMSNLEYGEVVPQDGAAYMSNFYRIKYCDGYESGFSSERQFFCVATPEQLRPLDDRYAETEEEESTITV